ncbi:hypothetical protein [Micromonospora chalcea]|uniref:hypothetical protein n=1 Tax=Micromonospora chalcea TaxID=1874 RepID=UPI003D708DF0
MKRRLVDTEVAAMALGVRPGTIRVMAHRGQLTRYGTRQRALWDLDELLDRLPAGGSCKVNTSV